MIIVEEVYSYYRGFLFFIVALIAVIWMPLVQGATASVPPDGEVQYYELGVSFSDRFIIRQGSTQLEAAWNYCSIDAIQEYARCCGYKMVLNSFSLVQTYPNSAMEYRCALEDINNPNISSHLYPVARPIKKPICPTDHPKYNEVTKRCDIDYSWNMGPSMCSLETNPIHAFSGNKYQTEIVYQVPNVMGLEFEWFYNSLIEADQSHWRHSYEMSIESNLEANVTTSAELNIEPPASVTAKVYRPDGNIYEFENDFSWSLRTTTHPRWREAGKTGGYSLETINDNQTGKAIGYKLYAKTKRVEEYNLDGRLKKIEFPGKSIITVEWEGDRIVSVFDEYGKSIQLIYDDQSGVINGINSSDGNVYGFDISNGLLSRIIFPDATPDNSTDNPSRKFLYQDVRFLGHLTSITDQRGIVAATWSYDDSGRAITSAHENGVDTYRLAYHEDGSTTITDPIGNSRNYTFANIDSLIRIGASTGGECMQCGASSKAFEYDSNGFVLSRTDWKGIKTAYTRDGFGQELSRTEAVGFPEEQTITTDWHPEFKVPLRITEPGRITEFRYDDKGHLLSKSEIPVP